jgi:SAM-dependent methyltransferase
MMKYEFIDPEEQIASPDFRLVESFLRYTRRTQIGWHYITDLTWIYRKIKSWPKGITVLDAGGGTGPTQFLLSELGFNVVNLDLILKEPSVVYCKRYNCKLKKLPSYNSTDYSKFISSQRNTAWKGFYRKTALYYLWKLFSLNLITYARYCEQWRLEHNVGEKVGNLQWIIGNLCFVPDIEEDTFDAVVSLSAIEHIPKEKLNSALMEINRIVKPGAYRAITTSGTDQSFSWFHHPSKGWCYSVEDIERHFNARSCVRSDPKQILNQYRNCVYLKKNIADFYKKSGNYGMPWGKWDPKYIPVGISSR